MRTEIDINIDEIAQAVRADLDLSSDDTLIDDVAGEVIDRIDTSDIVQEVIDSHDFETALESAVREALDDAGLADDAEDRLAYLERQVSRLTDALDAAEKLFRALQAG